MVFRRVVIFFGILIVFYEVRYCRGIDWSNIHCAADDIDPVPANGGTVPDSRFPWLGLIQHTFYLAEKMQYAVTAGVLIHPGYVLAPAEDIGKLPVKTFSNSTEFIVWDTSGDKYALNVIDYVVHPDYTNKITTATIALIRLTLWANGRRQAPVDPLCLPLKGMGTFDNLYVIKHNDNDRTIRKEILKVDYVVDKDCSEFYYRAQLSYENMKPQYPLCAVQSTPVGVYSLPPCLWDNGGLLVARLNHAYWTLLGYGVRGPGCGAPARFVGMHRMLEWIDATITSRPLEDLPEDSTAFYLRQRTPFELTLFKADTTIPTDYGQCERGAKEGRGGVQYKDVTEVVTNKNVVSGFYFVAVHSIAMFSCAIVKFECTARSFTALWVEHNCHSQETGLAHHMREGVRREKLECFIYFKTTAFVEFRFTFSFKGFVEMTLYGQPFKKLLLNPQATRISTDNWWPTKRIIPDSFFYPLYWNQWF